MSAQSLKLVSATILITTSHPILYHRSAGLNNDADNIEDSCDDMDMDIIEEEAEVSRILSCAMALSFSSWPYNYPIRINEQQ